MHTLSHTHMPLHTHTGTFLTSISSFHRHLPPSTHQANPFGWAIRHVVNTYPMPAPSISRGGLRSASVVMLYKASFSKEHQCPGIPSSPFYLPTPLLCSISHCSVSSPPLPTGLFTSFTSSSASAHACSPTSEPVLHRSCGTRQPATHFSFVTWLETPNHALQQCLLKVPSLLVT